MTREFPDELLSAYLDGEVTPAERAAVEAHLAASPADRQLLDELRSLRGEMTVLPKAAVANDFADRVVQAAVAAKAESLPLATPAQRGRRTWLWAASGLAAVAACLVVAVQLSRGPRPIALPPLSPAEQFLAALHTAVPGEGQAAVLRLRLPPNVQLQQALVAAGFATPAAAANTGAEDVAAAYQKQLRQRVGARFDEATFVAADALFVEGPLTKLEQALLALASDPALRCELRPEGRVAFAGTRRKSDGAEAEGKTGAPQASTRGPYVQQLAAGIYRLERQPTPLSALPSAPSIDGKMRVRLLILVERIDGR